MGDYIGEHYRAYLLKGILGVWTNYSSNGKFSQLAVQGVGFRVRYGFKGMHTLNWSLGCSSLTAQRIYGNAQNNPNPQNLP